MKIIDQSWSWVQKPLSPLQIIELAGRTCYKSEKKITEDSSEEFAKMLLRRNHESVIEHVTASVRFVTNRGVTHELVRHRLCAFSQESTRYVRYDGDMEFIKPVWWDKWGEDSKRCWETAMEASERSYMELLASDSEPQQAREVLPNSLKTEIVVTANLRQWRHMFGLRCSRHAHPQMRQLMLSCLQGFSIEIPVLFDDLLAANGV
jgi:thymidylate synthase (FAD)